VSDEQLNIAPVTLAQAKEFVNKHHRHHKAPVGHKFSIGLQRNGELVGVAQAGRPVARAYDDGLTLEVNRTCVVEGVKNGNSMLYGAVRRIAKAMGFKRVLTYTQEGESGVSLRAAGWQLEAELPPRKGWSAPSREREGNDNDNVKRYRWAVYL
jgi:hypothetical protein